MGVTTNPKVAHERQEKDKSDRATQDQVLDARTRLVLAGLVNRNLIGKIERCVSTGKEVGYIGAVLELNSGQCVFRFAWCGCESLSYFNSQLPVATNVYRRRATIPWRVYFVEEPSENDQGLGGERATKFTTSISRRSARTQGIRV